jgi:IgGFc binding protein
MRHSIFGPASAIVTLLVAACGTDVGSGFGREKPIGSGGDYDGGLFGIKDSEATDGQLILDRDPVTCAEALATRSYVGCDYWPTVTANGVNPLFDYAVIVSNVGAAPVQVSVVGPGGTSIMTTIAAKSLGTLYLPWVASLKGPNAQGLSVPALTESVLARQSAYHLVSSAPVIAYQFNALEYKAAGGPPGKDWSRCAGGRENCFSYSNDASLLLPSTAWTGNYRITGVKGYTYDAPIVGGPMMGGYIAITASENATQIDLRLPSTGAVLASAGGEITATAGGGTITLTLNAGDVAEVVTPKGEAYDLSGGLVYASKPVQVISGIQTAGIPKNQLYTDHLEETVQPAETFGKTYVVSAPSKPQGGIGGQIVRFYGNQDGTVLTYPAGKPSGCPDTLGGGEVRECGPVERDFVVAGSQEFALAGFMVGASFYDVSGNDKRGDPSQTVFPSIEQFRKEYIFLAPTDYTQNFAAIAGPAASLPALDGKALGPPDVVVGSFGIWRRALSNAGGGVHRLSSVMGVGLQVYGYGDHTSYQYPGGLNALRIAPVPPPILK